MARFSTWQPHFLNFNHRVSPWRDRFDRWCAPWDSGYACSPFLMTPYLNPKRHQEEQFNRAHKVTRCIIERTFGLLKSQFLVLHSVVRMAPDRVCTIVAACCILHDIAMNLRELDPEDCDMEDEGCAADLHSQHHGRETGNAVRQHITNTFF